MPLAMQPATPGTTGAQPAQDTPLGPPQFPPHIGAPRWPEGAQGPGPEDVRPAREAQLAREVRQVRKWRQELTQWLPVQEAGPKRRKGRNKNASQPRPRPKMSLDEFRGAFALWAKHHSCAHILLSDASGEVCGGATEPHPWEPQPQPSPQQPPSSGAQHAMAQWQDQPGAEQYQTQTFPQRQPWQQGQVQQDKQEHPPQTLPEHEPWQQQVQKDEAPQVEALQPIPKGATTLVVRNIPCDWTRDELEGEWPADGKYDYLHLLNRTDKPGSHGMAFINFVKHEFAVEFFMRWDRQRLSRWTEMTRLSVAVAALQGQYPNLLRFGRDALERDGVPSDNMPLVFFDGVRASTGVIKAWLQLGLTAEARPPHESDVPLPNLQHQRTSCHTDRIKGFQQVHVSIGCLQETRRW
mmetsp:Transcript_76343/g.210756  ORF Transcript_76343/g.210756 Transcript_76343/m.210756 type:complete len:409 (+) Transcript_76343:89-1315(+)